MRVAITAAVLAAGLTSAAAAAAAPAPGTATYTKVCSVCHQAGGVGMVGSYPPLAGRAGAIAGLPEGRRMMIYAVLYGMSGKIQAGNQTIMGVMDSFKHLKDSELADVLNYVSHLGGKKPPLFTPAEVAEVRKLPKLSPSQVNALARTPSIVLVAK